MTTIFFSQIFYVLCMHLVGLISPGPDFFVVAKNSMQFSRRFGFITACGITASFCIHLLYTILGLGILIAQSPRLFTGIKYAGCLYLIYLGAKALKLSFSSTELIEELPVASAAVSITTPWQAFREGLLTNLFNPKCTVYLLSIFSSVSSSETSLEQRTALGVLMAALTLAWFFMVVIFFSRPHTQRLFKKYEGVFHRIFGGVIIAFAIAIANFA